MHRGKFLQQQKCISAARRAIGMLSMILDIQVQIGLSLPGAGGGTSYPDDFQINLLSYFARGEVFLVYSAN